MIENVTSPGASVDVALTAPGEPLSVGNTPIGVATDHGVSLIITSSDGKRAVLILNPSEAIVLGGSIHKAGRAARKSARAAE